MHIRSLLARAVRLHPDNVALAAPGPQRTYGDVGERVARLGGALVRLGVQPHDRVAVLASNGPAFFELYFACAHVDAVLVPINVRLHPLEIRQILLDAEPRVFALEPALLPPHDDVPILPPSVRGVLWLGSSEERGPGPPCVASLGNEEAVTYDEALTCAPAPPGDGRGGDQLAHLYYTSGTTGRAKGVMLTHRNVCAHAAMTVAELRLDETDTWAHVAPMFHLADAWATFAITAVGGRHVFLPRFEPGDALACLARERVTITNLVPTMLNLMVKHASAREHDLSHVRLILSGGAPIAPDVVRQVEELLHAPLRTLAGVETRPGPADARPPSAGSGAASQADVPAHRGGEYVQTYGMTETSPFLTMSLLKAPMRSWPEPAQRAMRAKTGRPVLGIDLRVVAEDGTPVAADGRTVGEIQVRGETVTPGYWRQPEATAAAFTADGYLRTGDLAVVDAEGFVTIVDRAKDVIITGAEKVYGTEVENVLYAHPAVLEAAVFGVADERWGERVAAAVVLRDGATASAAELVELCRTRLAGFKVPREVRFLHALPRTGSGKIAKRLLRGEA